MRIDIVTLFPGFFASPLATSIVKRALDAGALEIHLADPRAHATDRHRTADDRPFGGGPGMVMKPELLFAAVEALPRVEPRVVALTTPQGRPFTQALAREWSQLGQLVILCGHYEGMDERVHEALADVEVSLGDFVLTGGEIPALAIVDAVARLRPGALGNEASHQEDSFEQGWLDHPHYTRQPEFRGMPVPPVLLSGDHARIAQWRRKEAIYRTLVRRPALFAQLEPTLDKAGRKLLAELRAEIARGERPPPP